MALNAQFEGCVQRGKKFEWRERERRTQQGSGDDVFSEERPINQDCGG